MHPYVTILETTLPVYTLFAGLGLIMATIVVNTILLKKMLVHKYSIIILTALPGIIVGGKLFGILSAVLRDMYWNKEYSFQDYFLKSGIAYYGGLFGYLLLLYVICKIKRLEFVELSEIVIVGTPLFHAFGRLGCFFAGCCYGVESNIWFAINYKVFGSKKWSRRIPVQLIEALFELCVFVLMYYLYNCNDKVKKADDTRLVGLYLMLYAIFRFIIEIWRGDDVRGMFGKVSFSQVISIFIIAIIIHKKLVRRR